MEGEAMVESDPINPLRVFSELSPRLPDDVMLSADSGSAANWYARQLKVRPGMRGSLSGTLATMGPDRKSTRLNSSHVATSYAVCCSQKTRPGPAPTEPRGRRSRTPGRSGD